jgi:hypothetical protein
MSGAALPPGRNQFGLAQAIEMRGQRVRREAKARWPNNQRSGGSPGLLHHPVGRRVAPGIGQTADAPIYSAYRSLRTSALIDLGAIIRTSRRPLMTVTNMKPALVKNAVQ